ncbi:MAG: heavy-metal-associated domain-containing protein [Burkholderiaceae bacterium]
MSTLTFEVSGMHCGKCVGRMTEAFSQWAERAHVTLNPPRLVLDNPRTQDVQKLAAIAAAAGNYAIAPLTQTAPAATATPAAAVSIPISTIARAKPAAPQAAAQTPGLARYKPLAIIFGFITLASLITPLREGAFYVHAWMHDFMGAFFLVFAFLKLLDIRGFASAFAMYDPIAKRWPGYGLIYPFIELALGLAFLLYWNMVLACIFTILVLGITTVGVARVLLNKQTIQCACIGTGFNLPMSQVTIIENLLMIGMSVWMLTHIFMH